MHTQPQGKEKKKDRGMDKEREYGGREEEWKERKKERGREGERECRRLRGKKEGRQKGRKETLYLSRCFLRNFFSNSDFNFGDSSLLIAKVLIAKF